MKKEKIILKPIDVSAIKPIYNNNGIVSEWGVVVTYDGQNVEPPHARGARISVKNTDKNTLAEYHFCESVMKQGLERAYLFHDAMVKQIARQNMER